MIKKYVTKRDFKEWENLIFKKFKNDKRKYIQDKFILFFYNPNLNKIPNKTKIKMFHIGKKEFDSVSYGLDDDKETFKLPATDTGGLTNISINIKNDKWSHKEILFFQYIKDPIQNYVIDEIFSIWENLSNKKFNLSIKNNLKKWIESRPKNFQLGIARIYPQKSIIIPAEEIKKKIGYYMFRNYSGDDSNYAYLTNNIKNLFCKITKDKITPNINKSNMDIEYNLIIDIK